MDRALLLADACRLLDAEGPEAAASLLDRRYPHAPAPPGVRARAPHEMLRVFLRDGFVDRYDGRRLVFPGVFGVLSARVPDAFPAHPNWRMGRTHVAYYELWPTLDHVVPVTRGGPDEEANLVTTSMMRNSAKSSWTLEELEWTLRPPGDLTAWDGLLSWFLAHVARDPDLLARPTVRRWHLAARRAPAALPARLDAPVSTLRSDGG